MSKDKMTTQQAIKYYEDEAKKAEIRSMCEKKPTLKAGYKKLASRFKAEAEAIRSLWGKKYTRATRFTDKDQYETTTKVIHLDR